MIPGLEDAQRVCHAVVNVIHAIEWEDTLHHWVRVSCWPVVAMCFFGAGDDKMILPRGNGVYEWDGTSKREIRSRDEFRARCY